MLACGAAVSWMLHDSAGNLLDLGRRRRRPNAALRRAARERDTCRCRFPGCESRRVDLHHIQYWSNGGRTTLDNLVSLCKHHHTLVHDRGYLIAARPDGTFAFHRPDGTPIPSSPALPDVEGTIEGCHEAGVTPETIIPPWYGERLDLDHAIYICFANARTEEERRAGRDQASEPRVPEPRPGLRTGGLGRPDPPVLRRARRLTAAATGRVYDHLPESAPSCRRQDPCPPWTTSSHVRAQPYMPHAPESGITHTGRTLDPAGRGVPWLRDEHGNEGAARRGRAAAAAHVAGGAGRGVEEGQWRPGRTCAPISCTRRWSSAART